MNLALSASCKMPLSPPMFYNFCGFNNVGQCWRSAFNADHMLIIVECLWSRVVVKLCTSENFNKVESDSTSYKINHATKVFKPEQILTYNNVEWCCMVLADIGLVWRGLMQLLRVFFSHTSPKREPCHSWCCQFYFVIWAR
jgi:hypothetical protein